MPELDDIELLSRFARQNSEEAFATLVARHVNLVYSVALRKTGNPHAAQEITQAVFIILAKKARSLRAGVILSGWLYQTARLTAANFLRTEIRRQRREQEAHMESLLNEPESDVWPQIAPLLDDAMARLGEKDRNALVLRFFENKSLRGVGTELGASEGAAKVRVSRALEKLRKFFAKRGFTLSVAVIAGAVSANSVQAAPVSLTISAVTAAKGSAVTASTLALAKGTLKLMAWAKMKMAITGICVVLAVGTTAVSVTTIHNRAADALSLGECYTAARNGDVFQLQQILDDHPEFINRPVAVDENSAGRLRAAGQDPAGFHATLLHTAAFNGRQAVVEELLRRNADVNARTSDGHTPLYDCVDNKGTAEIALILLEHGADFTIAATDTGQTPLQLAIAKNRRGFADVLRQHGAKE